MIRKIKKLAFCISFCFALITSITTINAAEITIISPEHDSKMIADTQASLNINWKVENTVNPAFSYDLNLKNAVCKDFVRAVNKIDSKTVRPGSYSNSVNISDLPQGTYCINLCIYDLSEIECNNRLFVIAESTDLVTTSDESTGGNKPPAITSFPSKLTLNYLENFNYQIQAQDPNGDVFTYRLVSAPDFIYLNQQNGTITNTVRMRPGSYFIAFVAIDRNGAYTQQNFTINVFEKHDSSGNPIDPNTTSTPTPPAEQKVFEIIRPKTGELLAGTNNSISWNIKNYDYDKIDIYYQIENGQWTLLRDITDKNVKSFEWNVTGLTNGKYKLKFELKKGGNIVEMKEISNLIVGNNTNSSSLLILNIKPNNQSEIAEKKPEISANILPSDSSKVDFEKSEVWLDNKKITKDCSLNNNEIKCFIDKDLSLKEHTVKMKVVDTNGQELQQQWSFTVVEEVIEPTPTPTPGTGTGSNITPTPTPSSTQNGITLFVDNLRESVSNIGMNTWLYCCGGLLLLLAGFFVLRTLRNRTASSPYGRDNDTEEVSEAAVIPTETPAAEEDSNLEDFTDYSVGDYSVGEDDYEPIMPSTNTATEEPVATPNFGASTNSDILPDWLKGNTEESSKPVNPKGEAVADSFNTANLNEGAQVHDSFGLTVDNGGDEEDKTKKNDVI